MTKKFFFIRRDNHGLLVIEFCAFMLMVFLILVLCIPLLRREIVSSNALIVLASLSTHSPLPTQAEQGLISKMFGANAGLVQLSHRSFRDTPASHFYDFEEISVSYPSCRVKEKIIQEKD